MRGSCLLLFAATLFSTANAMAQVKAKASPQLSEFHDAAAEFAHTISGFTIQVLELEAK